MPRRGEKKFEMKTKQREIFECAITFEAGKTHRAANSYTEKKKQTKRRKRISEKCFSAPFNSCGRNSNEREEMKTFERYCVAGFISGPDKKIKK